MRRAHGDIFVGTVRARRDAERFVVVGRDGKVRDVIFKGEVAPLIGGDVVGRITINKIGEYEMNLRGSLTEAMLEGSVRITMLGSRKDLTARMLAKFLAKQKSALISPGTGSSIDRMNETDDPDLAWALSTLKPEADKAGIALNVVDVLKVARSVWDNATMRDRTLPADIEGSRKSMDEIVRLLRSGFHPTCSRMIERFTGKGDISVNFILPYAPFSGATGFAKQAAKADNSVFPLTTMTVSEARRISSARMLALGFAHMKLLSGEMQSDVTSSRRAEHVANCFADACAVLAFLSSGGRSEAALEYADLKESSLFFGLDDAEDVVRPGVLADATHAVIRKAVASAREGMSSDEIVRIARKLSTRYALPMIRFTDGPDAVLPAEIDAAVDAANRVAVDIRSNGAHARALAETRYRRELRELVDEFSADPISVGRLVTFARLNVPLGMSDIFREETAGLLPDHAATAAEVIGMIADKGRFVDRLRLARTPSGHDDRIELAEVRI